MNILAGCSTFSKKVKSQPTLWAIGLLSIFLIASLSYHLYSDMALLTATSDTQKETQPAIVARAQAFNINALAKAHLFGTSDNSMANTSPVTLKISETSLKLELHGVFGSSSETGGRALISEKNQPAQYYKVKDSLPGGAILTKVVVNHVLLNRQGRLETLSLNTSRVETSSVSKQEPHITSALTANMSSIKPADFIKEHLIQLRASNEQ